MDEAPTIFERRAAFDPEGDFEAFLRQVPAKWVVYLLADADGRPIQLLCVKNLRYSLRRRLGGGEMAGGLSRRVDYRELVRKVFWRRVDSAFEADWLYYEAARVVFPQSYQGIIGFRPAWFVHVDPDANFPRYTKTTDLSAPSGLFIGPVEDKHAAARLIELVEDAFDLCRYYNILIQAPVGKACAYKEMGKCPAPCDGSISMQQYRLLIDWSARTLQHPEEHVRQQAQRMQQAAAELRFETAGKIKQYVDELSKLGKGPFRYARRLKDFGFLAVQPGPRAGTAKVFLVTPGRIEEIAGILGEHFRPADVLRIAFERAAARDAEAGAVGRAGAERLGVVSHHLFAPKQAGAFLGLDTVDEKAVQKAWRDVTKRAPEEAEVEAEGVMKELQAM